MARKLRDILIEEVSLVDEPANRRRFAVIKRQRNGNMKEELKKQLEQLLGRKLTEEEVSKAQVTDEEAEGLGKHLGTLLRYMDDLPAEVVKAIGEVARGAALSQKVGADEADKGDDKETLESLVEQIIGKTMEKFVEALKKELGELTQKIEGLSKDEDEEEEEVEESDEEATVDDLKKMIVEELRSRGIQTAE